MYSGAGSHSFQAKFTQLGYNKVMTRQAYNKYAKYNIDTVLHASFGYTRDSISSDDNESKRQLNSCYSFFNRLFDGQILDEATLFLNLIKKTQSRSSKKLFAIILNTLKHKETCSQIVCEDADKIVRIVDGLMTSTLSQYNDKCNLLFPDINSFNDFLIYKTIMIDMDDYIKARCVNPMLNLEPMFLMYRKRAAAETSKNLNPMTFEKMKGFIKDHHEFSLFKQTSYGDATEKIEIVKKNTLVYDVIEPNVEFENFSMYFKIENDLYLMKLKKIVSYDDCGEYYDIYYNTSSAILVPFLTQIHHVEYTKLTDFVNTYGNTVAFFHIEKMTWNEIEIELLKNEPPVKAMTEDELLELFNEDKPIKASKKKNNKKKKHVEKVEKIEPEKIEPEKIEPEKIEPESDPEPESEPESEPEPIILCDAVVKIDVISQRIIFSTYEPFKCKNELKSILENKYHASEKFKQFINQYTTLLIIRDLHYDANGYRNSLHFNMKCYNELTHEKSSTLHLYIADGEIFRITFLSEIDI